MFLPVVLGSPALRSIPLAVRRTTALGGATGAATAATLPAHERVGRSRAAHSEHAMATPTHPNLPKSPAGRGGHSMFRTGGTAYYTVGAEIDSKAV